MTITYAIFKVTDHFGPIWQRVAAIAGHLGVAELARILIAIVKVHQALAGHEPTAEFTFVDPIVVVEHTETVQVTISELAFVLELVVGPLIDTFAVEDSILELSFI